MPDARHKEKHMSFIRLKVSSGLEVEIRPRSYEEWEKQEDARLAAIEGVPALLDAGKRPQGEMLLQRAFRDTRSLRLAVWVKDFPKLKGKLTLRDIAEIERFAEALEAVEIAEGNSGAGGNGP
jgi:hypothetical protein